MVVIVFILGDPGAESRGEGKSKQQKNMARRKVKNGEKSAAVWNWSGTDISPGALLAVLYFSSRHIFPPV